MSLNFNFQLGGKITTEVDPTKSKPKDVSVIETLSEMIAKGSSLLTKYNNSGNATVDFFNVTDGFSFGKIAFVMLLDGVVLGGEVLFKCFFVVVVVVVFFSLFSCRPLYNSFES